MDLLSLCQRLISSPRQPAYSGFFSPEGIAETAQNSPPVLPGQRYFQFRLSQMHLKDSRVLWKGYIPMVIAVVDFLYDGEREIVPVYLGNNLLDLLGKVTAKEDIIFYNSNILGPAPYLGDDIGFFLGLFQVESSDLSQGFFNLAQTLAGTFDKALLSNYVAIARSLEKGLSGLLGLDEVGMQMGIRKAFTDIEHDSCSLREGYLVYINGPAAEIDTGRLRIREDRLCIQGRGNQTRPFESHDFCVVKILCQTRRGDYRALGFNRLYNEAVAEIFKNNFPRARHVFLNLMQEIALSPDLIRAQKFQLIKLYKANLARQRELFIGTAPKSITRGASASETLNTIAYIAGVNQLPGEVKQGIKDMARNMDEILGAARPEQKLTDLDLARQLDRLDHMSPVEKGDPEDLVKAITISYDMENQGP